MSTPVLINTETLAFWIILILAMLMLKGHGQKLVARVLQKLYELFIGSKDHISPL
jgi:hypothetical protein